MSDLYLYRALSRLSLNYRVKIMTVAFLGTHIPLIALVAFIALEFADSWTQFAAILGVTLAAALVGTGLTLLALNELLKPVLDTSRALRAYRETRTLTPLPTLFTDEVGTLMADASQTLSHLDAVLDALEMMDETTGLANRRRLLDAIEEAMASDEKFSVGVLRVANVPRISEALDSLNVEATMLALTGRLRGALPAGALLARVGQGEFAVLLPALGDRAVLHAFANLAFVCRRGIALRGLTVRPAIFVGIATRGADVPSAAALLDHAVAAAVRAGPSLPIAHHSKDAREAALDRLRIEEDLRRALAADEFRLYYQPVVDVAAGCVRGAEALIRWQHPSGVLIQPGHFIPVAEASGLIDGIGLWTLREACRQVADWNARGHTSHHVAVNLSARQFLDPDLRAHVAEAIETAGIAPSQLEIELTESAAMTDQDTTRRIFTRLRDLGVTIAIDDFGTGYASMSYLRRLPFDKLKIDREFVVDVHLRRDGDAICTAMIALANGLGLTVLAEGTETEEEVRHLAARGCNLFQGFHFARPLPASEFLEAVEGLRAHPLLRGMSSVPRQAPAPSYILN